MSDTASGQPWAPGETPADRLQALLERQLALVHQGRVGAAVALFAQTDRCVQEIARTGALPPGPRVERLYRDLSLALTAQRAEVAAALQAIGRGKQALRAYSSAAGLRR